VKDPCLLRHVSCDTFLATPIVAQNPSLMDETMSLRRSSRIVIHYVGDRNSARFRAADRSLGGPRSRSTPIRRCRRKRSSGRERSLCKFPIRRTGVVSLGLRPAERCLTSVFRTLVRPIDDQYLDRSFSRFEAKTKLFLNSRKQRRSSGINRGLGCLQRLRLVRSPAQIHIINGHELLESRSEPVVPIRSGSLDAPQRSV
jgi:hypothetical protein